MYKLAAAPGPQYIYIYPSDRGAEFQNEMRPMENKEFNQMDDEAKFLSCYLIAIPTAGRWPENIQTRWSEGICDKTAPGFTS